MALLVSTVVLCMAASAAGASHAAPEYERVRAALERAAAPSRLTVSVASVSAIHTARSQAVIRSGQRDSVWDGLLIGAGIGAASGYVWARNICGSNDPECFAIASTVGVLGGTAIGAAVGAIVDALHK